MENTNGKGVREINCEADKRGKKQMLQKQKMMSKREVI